VTGQKDKAGSCRKRGKAGSCRKRGKAGSCRKGGEAEEAALVARKGGEGAQQLFDAQRGQCKHQPLDYQHQAKAQEEHCHGCAGAGLAAVTPFR
jgi:hypothetical protein